MTRAMTRSRLVVAFALLAALAPVVLVVARRHRARRCCPPRCTSGWSAAPRRDRQPRVARAEHRRRPRPRRPQRADGHAFSTMTALFAIHALATPGLHRRPERHDRRSPAASRSRSAPCMLGADRAARAAPPRLRRAALVALQGALFVGVIVLGLIGLAIPEAVPAVPQAQVAPGDRPAGRRRRSARLLIVRAVRTYLLTRRAADLTVALGCAWLARHAVRQPRRSAAVTLGFYARPPARDLRRRARRRPGRAGHQARRRLAPARRRPHRDRAGRRPRRPTSARACAP